MTEFDGSVPADNEFTGTAKEFGGRPTYETACGACSACQSNQRDADLLARGKADGMAGVEVLGAPAKCLRLGQPQPMRRV